MWFLAKRNRKLFKTVLDCSDLRIFEPRKLYFNKNELHGPKKCRMEAIPGDQ